MKTGLTPLSVVRTAKERKAASLSVLILMRVDVVVKTQWELDVMVGQLIVLRYNRHTLYQ